MTKRLSMFRSATLKLTVAYMAIALFICILFSAALYQVAARELRGQLLHSYQRWNYVISDYDQPPETQLPTPAKDIAAGSHHIMLNLFYVNILVLIAAGFMSYGLARRTLQPIEDAHEQQKRFTADVSHELRTPLTALRMETEVALLDKGAQPLALRKVLQSNLEEADKLEALINNLLRLSKLELSEARESFEALRLQVILDEAVKAQVKQAKRRKITIKPVTTDLLIEGDQAALIQLITILLDNALKYSPSGSTITLAAKSASHRAIISITDEGKGIDPASLPHVFDRFYRADDSRTNSSSQGYGLGLSLAKMITELHDGTIELTSQVDKGTTAIVKLPLLEATPANHQKAA